VERVVHDWRRSWASARGAEGVQDAPDSEPSTSEESNGLQEDPAEVLTEATWDPLDARVEGPFSARAPLGADAAGPQPQPVQAGGEMVAVEGGCSSWSWPTGVRRWLREGSGSAQASTGEIGGASGGADFPG
jgi:hypothetical protein